MKTNIIPSMLLTTLFLIVLGGFYPALMWGIAQVAPNKGKGITVETPKGKQYVNIGQSFTSMAYFWSRPSAVAYNAAGSGASNDASSKAEYLEEVQGRIDDFIERNPEVQREDIPVDLVTASGSGLDPHISIQAAHVQIARIAKERGLAPSRIEQLIAQHTQQPLWGFLGPQTISVLQLNIALDQLK
ncbi:potassium-transporting ATPase subunit KdpC [Myroides sp. DF42-4-2]|uniref:potassium-transporting ATPase subunit KdpC n=1 Tax=unclassified Myroides TaxID=2642485 RepID=UPI0025777C68|nr:potassium-transporting ATPase subunit KdpC [Myroides sp. DF42-4-2]MDM1407475.1 potassium-transporting ATPase subunit KdpC [Myroides sp. DF42-4-2]